MNGGGGSWAGGLCFVGAGGDNYWWPSPHACQGRDGRMGRWEGAQLSPGEAWGRRRAPTSGGALLDWSAPGCALLRLALAKPCAAFGRPGLAVEQTDSVVLLAPFRTHGQASRVIELWIACSEYQIQYSCNYWACYSFPFLIWKSLNLSSKVELKWRSLTSDLGA
jgi:hypothetical protein